MEIAMSEREERARETARNLANAVNEMGFDVDVFADELLRQHRTLQQSAFGAFLATVKAWAALAPSHFDARNEFTVDQSRKIVEALGKYNLKVPFI
jgi:predicted pyridoxine 5'-phosphate oxidase superfamily flavin-nucleotide-binding protein